MRTLFQRFTVPFAYPVRFTENLLDPGNPLLRDTLRSDEGPSRVLPVLDGGLLARRPDLPGELRSYARAHGEDIELAVDPVVVPGGEDAKNEPELVEEIHRALQEAGICRHSYVLAIGGGAVIDLAGYAAATAHRGIRLVRVPTTVLAQNDAAIGVKNGVNAFGSKNFLGTFAPPHAVLNDFGFLETLDDRDWRAGISEAVKVALIKDGSFFDRIEKAARALAPPERDSEEMAALIHRCAELHLEHIATSGDPFETGSSRPLDFGHWAAHRLEHLTDYRLRHGEAVAIGMALDATYSHLQGLLAEEEWRRIVDVLEACGFALYVPAMSSHLDEPDHPRGLFRGLEEFREHLGGRLTIMLLGGIGRGFEVHEVEARTYVRAVERLKERHLRAASAA